MIWYIEELELVKEISHKKDKLKVEQLWNELKELGIMSELVEFYFNLGS